MGEIKKRPGAWRLAAFVVQPPLEVRRASGAAILFLVEESQTKFERKGEIKKRPGAWRLAAFVVQPPPEFRRAAGAAILF